ncbi:98.4 kDA DNA-directed RNA polymerase [Spodoptera frugiperda ascovirus 1a]|uniref:DNA-directed RNA polymerase subunit n=1 Tax=Spodoptera frugiperda ascovirus 1a TaxID=113370 RepID=Q0E593_SFAVA|nr:98.4 kDA DNA-directed RNA polymerase [Spodoptera frugiperda ascovirus 1a]CAL44608.1 98.4 kDA DNA-directed RNA polymerase [Spodoptera frugiperda ascovirus 1a]
MYIIFKSRAIRYGRGFKMSSTLSKIEYFLMSPDEIEDLSTYAVTKHRPTGLDTVGTVFDSRGGAHKAAPCGTCGQNYEDCPGHFGVITLCRPIIHPLFTQNVREIMRLVCSNCHRTIISPDMVQDTYKIRSKGPKRISDLLSLLDRRVSACAHCGTPPCQYRLSCAPTSKTSKAKRKIHRTLCRVTAGNVKEWLDDDDVAAILDDVPDVDADRVLGCVHPSRLILRKWPAIPSVCRHQENGRSSGAGADGGYSDDDITVLLCDIVRLNNIAGSPERGEDERAKAFADLKTKISVICTNTAKMKRNDNGDPVCGILDRIKGKNGLIRNNLLGKRSEMAARTVIGPDPTLRLEEVGFPRCMANHLYIPERVTVHNYAWACSLRIPHALYPNTLVRPKYIRNGRIHRACVRGCKSDECLKRCTPSIGDYVCRPLRDGDVVLMNRQPTLHKGSMMAFRIRLHDSLIFTLNLAVTKAFNADFDGDEMNAFIPQSSAACSELLTLSTPTACLNSGDKASICIVQDCLTAAYLMSVEDVNAPSLDRDMTYDILMCFTGDRVDAMLEKLRRCRRELDCRLPGHVYNGRLLISLAIPDRVWYECDGLRIDGGVLKSGRFTKRTLGPSRDSLIRYIGNHLGRQMAGEFVDDLQFLTTAWMKTRAFSVTARDFLHAGQTISQHAEEKIKEAVAISSTIMDDRFRELRLNTVLATAKDIGMRIVKQSSEKTIDNLAVMIESGSKGDYFNVGQTKGMLGQQMINGSRIPMNLSGGTRTTIHSRPGETDQARVIRDRGYICRGFSNGLDPCEWLFHCMSGRESVCSSATETADTGYTTRRVNKFSEDIIIHNDGIVAVHSGNIYQLTYGDMGLDPENPCRDVDDIIRSIGGIVCEGRKQ